MALFALSRHCKHHVFPSFHGEDVRRGLLSYLLKEFREKGIDVFIDNDIERSKSIGPELKKAIRGSMIAIVLISRNYAKSTWCLNELVEIMKCRDAGIQMVMVIFHEVEPSDVKKQTGYFGVVFEKTCAGKTMEEVERWRHALQEVAKIAGYHSLKFDSDAVMTETIATDVSNKLNDSTASNVFDGLVGVGTHIKKIDSLLSLESDEVRMVGIWGPAGIGKTTIARALYRKESSKFIHSAFIESVKGKFEQNYRDEHAFMLHLQEQLLSKTLNHKGLKIGHLGVAKARLKNKKVLVVLDDVDDLKQLEAMTNKTCWFGPGSRIIITTKDKKLLKAHDINHIYEVGFPSTSEALEILCLSAFHQNSPSFGFEDMALEVTRLAGNLPLGLSVFGSYLREVPKDQWIHALPRLKTTLDGNIEKVLKFSYDALCGEDQELFLHIACFFRGECMNDVVEYLAESRLNVTHGIQVLVDKSLISIHEGYLVMHNLLEQLGKEIVRRQSVYEPGKRQFLVDSQEICDVLEDNAGTGAIRGIDFDLSEIRGELTIDERAFEGMSHLQFLRFHQGYDSVNIHIRQGLSSIPRKIRFLHWENFPSTFLPPKFHPQYLVKLEMQNSNLEKLWEGQAPLPCLKQMNLSGSSYLKEVPDLSSATNLEELRLEDCISLVELPSSIGNATNLKTLNLTGCYSLVELPSSIWSLKRLEELLIAGCSELDYWGSQLKALPEISTTIGEEVPSRIMTWPHLHTLIMNGCRGIKMFPYVPDSIEVLDLSETGIKEVPSSIQNLSRLTELRMVGCKKLKVLPTNINLESLSSLDLSHCNRLKMFPEISTSIEYLDMRDTAIEAVPSSIWSWFRLLELNLEDCKSLHVFHGSIKELNFSNTETNLLGGVLETIPDCINHLRLPLRINLNGCKSLVALPHLPDSLSYLDAANCESLERIDGFFTNPETCLNFANCFELSQEVRENMEISDFKFVLLPGRELPAYFGHHASGDYIVVNLNQRPLPLFFRFKVCLLLLHGLYFWEKYFEENDEDDEGDSDSEDDEVDHWRGAKMLSCRTWCIQNGIVTKYESCKYHIPALHGYMEHLYFFESSISLNFPETDVNSNELVFQFKIVGGHWKIKGCGVRLWEDPVFHGSSGNICNDTIYKESADTKIGKNLHAGKIRTRKNFRLPYSVSHRDSFRNNTRELDAFDLVGLLCIGILVYIGEEKFLILLLPLLVYDFSCKEFFLSLLCGLIVINFLLEVVIPLTYSVFQNNWK